MDHRVGKRLLVATLALGAAFGIVMLRLAWLQLAGGQAVRSAGTSALAFLQRSDSLVLDSGRGQFYDRAGRKLTGETVWALTAFPEPGLHRVQSGGEKEEQQQLARLAEIVGAEPAELKRWLHSIREADVWRLPGSKQAAGLTDEQAEAVGKLDLAGVAALPYRNRYPDGLPIAPLHAIGYISQNPERLMELYGEQVAAHEMRVTDRTGGAGLELSLDRLVKGVGRTEAILMTDAARRPLEGLGLRVTAPDNPHYPLRVKTTIDLNAQLAVEQTMAKHRIHQGAVVVLDTADADVLAMASLPRLDPDRIGDPATDARNHALIAVPPGSVFKTVTLAAALEAGVTTRQERFRCTGEYGRYGLHCWKTGGHGILTLEQAYADSCNVVFAALAERLHPEALQKTADRLGLGRRIGWNTGRFIDGGPLRLLQEEESGTVFKDVAKGRDGGVRTGTGIGQRDVRISPLQAANLAVTLLHDGRVLAPRIVSEIRYADGGLAAELPPQTSPSAYGRIRPQTAAALRRAMKAVVAEGTAERALADSKWPLAGKSGTAELGDKQPKRNDHWFVGYGPAEGKARYAVAVLIENQPAGARNRAADVFGDIMAALRRLDTQKPGSSS
ncbi:penicillin-binding transpeptidase domain-containing protein [Cohnella lubricantis]|uniref:Penicillin-binding protein n=1 Tax=Cohnella lubricantis TaxID=2163172 RepID=A0A841T9B7_9BACL|nr:penicillin-binding transpeptidase domain-containing protein [Cohnella lubricantis]MBB6675840.1 penicillin-binding protein [Cohnella lubricantis]MBP2119746.1 cell division protein FtsI/penicillin-binding protein 2 [Cohnella lubricantis]